MSVGRLSAFIRRLHSDIAAGQPGGLSDAQLLDRWLVQRDQAAFEVLLWRHGPMILSVCRRVLNQDADVEDAFQAAFLLLVRKAAAIRRRESLAAWLYQTAYRVALRARQRSAKQSSRETTGVEWLGADPSAAMVWREVRPILDDEINRLPEKYRIPFIRCYLEGCTNEEVAFEMGCPLGTIHSRLARARERLRSRLTRRGVTLATAGLTALLVHGAASAVSPALAETTLQAAFAYAGHPAVAGASAGAVTLAEEVLRSMSLTKLKLGAAVLLAMTLCAGIGVAFYHQPEAAPLPSDGGSKLTVAPSPQPSPQPAPGEVRRFTVEEWAWSVSFSPNSRQILIGTGGLAPVRVCDISAGEEVLRTTPYHSCWSTAYSPDGKAIAVGSGIKPIEILDAGTGQLLHKLQANAGRVRNITYSPDGRLIASSHADGLLRLWDVAQGRVLLAFPAHHEAVHSAAFTPDGKHLLVIDPGTALRLYEVGSGREVRRFEGHTARVIDVAVSADGQCGLSCSADKTLRLWDLQTGEELLQMEDPDGGLHGVAFCPDGRRALSGGGNTIRLWDLTTGRQLHRFDGHEGGVCCVAVSPDGRYAVSGSSDHTVRLWRLPAPAPAPQPGG
jgi:RNA polymerase sigma factor (sigma-70 family)